jgi:L-rhamnose mutarotase
MQRFGCVIGLNSDRCEEYLARHRGVWPEVAARIRESHFTNYTIFVFGDLLFAYYEYTGGDYVADSAAIAADPTTKHWWTLTDPCQVRLPGTPTVSSGPP